MLGNIRKQEPLLITSAEIIRLYDFTTCDTIYISHDLRDDLESFLNGRYEKPDRRWNQRVIDSLLFEAGRIQGKREERKRRRG